MSPSQVVNAIRSRTVITDMSTTAAAAEALHKATEALHTASEAMAHAAKVYATETHPESMTATMSEKTAGKRPQHLECPPSQLPSIPARASSLNQPSFAATASKRGSREELRTYNNTSASMSPNVKTARSASPRFSHVDLLQAVAQARIGGESHISGGKEVQRSQMSSYCEDVADRNLSFAHLAWMATSDTEALTGYPRNHRHLPPNKHHPLRIPINQKSRMSGIHESIFLLVICLAQFLMQASLSQTIAPLPYLKHTLGGEMSTWYSAAYALTLGTFILPSGRLGDVFGHKRLFLTGWGYFAVCSTLCGIAEIYASHVSIPGGNMRGSELYFVVMRALQGVGPAVLLPNALALLGRVYPPGTKKNMLFALFGWCAPLGFVGGSAMSALLTQTVGWRWMFFALGIVCTVTGIVAYLVVPDVSAYTHHSAAIPTIAEKHNPIITSTPPTTMKTWRTRWLQLDITGSILGVLALILFNISLNQAPLVGWSTPYTYFLLLLSLIFFILFILSQSPSMTTTPLIPIDVMDTPTLFVLACTFTGWSAFGIWIFYTWEYLLLLGGGDSNGGERGPGLTPLLGAAWFSPAVASGLVASAATGAMLSKLHPRWIMLFSMVAFFIGTTIMATSGHRDGSDNLTEEPWSVKVYFTGVFWSVVVMPWGMDMSFPSATILLSDRVGEERQGVAASLVNTVVCYGISLGLGVAGTAVRYTREGNEEVVGDGYGGNLSRDDFRHAWYAAMGLSGMGVLMAAAFVSVGYLKVRRTKRECMLCK